MRNKKLWKRLTALMMASAMMVAMVGGTTVKGAENEEIELTIWANNWNPIQGLGAQYNPIADKVAEETGVRMNVFESNNGAGESEQLTTMRAFNDLPDIFYVPDMETMNQLIEAGQVMELSEYWNAEELTNIASEDGEAASLQNFMSDMKFDGKRYCVGLWSGTGTEDQPSCGLYVPWEIYKEAGYPQVESLDDLVDALEKMNEVYSETEDGQKVFGTGAWFAEDGAWGSWCVEGIMLAMGYESKDYIATFDVTTNDLMDTCTITDPDSLYWQAVEFWYNMNQRGLVDQDSITQKTDQWQEKAYSGRYILTMPSWETVSQKNGANMSWIALKPFTDATVLDWSGETACNMYAISSNCENPEAALKLLDYLCSPEGTRIVSSGIEGEGWEMVDGKAQYTEQYKADVASLTDAELAEKYGEVPGHFRGFATNVISPVDNSPYSLEATAEYRASTLTEAEEDAFAYYGVDSRREIYTKDTTNVKYMCGEYVSNMSTLPDDLQKNNTDLASFVQRNYLSCIFASDDEEFAAQKQAIIDGAADYNAEGLFQWYKEEFTKSKTMIDSYLQ